MSVQGHNGCVNCVKFSPDGSWLASAGEDSRVKVGIISRLSHGCFHIGPYIKPERMIICHNDYDTQHKPFLSSLNDTGTLYKSSHI